MLAMRDPRYRNYAIEDLRWIVEPAVLTGNFVVASGKKKEGGPSIPIGAVIWARVSELVDARLEKQKGKRPLRLSPEEMVSGDIYWLVHAFGPPPVVKSIIEMLTREGGVDENGQEVAPGPLAGKKMKMGR